MGPSDNNYLFFDGSSLIAQIRTLWRETKFKSCRLDPLALVEFLTSGLGSSSLIDFTQVRSGDAGYFRKGLPYKRAVFYFADGDSQIAEFLELPDATIPRLVRDVNFKYCGKKLPRSSKYDEWVETVPPEFQERITRSEKGVDVQICCDALQLAAAGHVDRIFLMTNDSDFIPLCDKLKFFGANISLIQLPGRAVNNDLAAACDSYYEIPQTALDRLFKSAIPKSAPAP